MSEFEVRLKELVAKYVVTLVQKDHDYAGSWKKRGGVGAYMMLARKWDRIEAAVTRYGNKWDVIEAALNDLRPEGTRDDQREIGWTSAVVVAGSAVWRLPAGPVSHPHVR